MQHETSKVSIYTGKKFRETGLQLVALGFLGNR